jgi:hypothetical protein
VPARLAAHLLFAAWAQKRHGWDLELPQGAPGRVPGHHPGDPVPGAAPDDRGGLIALDGQAVVLSGRGPAGGTGLGGKDPVGAARRVNPRSGP